MVRGWSWRFTTSLSASLEFRFGEVPADAKASSLDPGQLVDVILRCVLVFAAIAGSGDHVVITMGGENARPFPVGASYGVVNGILGGLGVRRSHVFGAGHTIGADDIAEPLRPVRSKGFSGPAFTHGAPVIDHLVLGTLCLIGGRYRFFSFVLDAGLLAGS